MACRDLVRPGHLLTGDHVFLPPLLKPTSVAVTSPFRPLHLRCIHPYFHERSSQHVLRRFVIARSGEQGIRGHPPQPCVFLAFRVIAMAACTPRLPGFPHVRSRSGAIDVSAHRVLFHDRMDVCRYYPSFLLLAIAYFRIAQRRSIILRRIRLVRVSDRQLLAGASSFPPHTRRLLLIKFSSGLFSSPLRLLASSRVLLGTTTPPSISRTNRPSPL